MIGSSAALRAVHRRVSMVARTDSTVLILGETGTGKELVARAIHALSPRSRRPLVSINCAAIQPSLITSELFGHEKGAFTGALIQRKGRFELADGGSLFLDEIGDIPLELQPKLLRVLQEQEFERLGSSHTIRTNVRVVAATSRDLRRMVTERRFRDDLYYRLNIFPIAVPPLRERPTDIPLLVRYFVSKYERRMNKTIQMISKETMDAMVRYDWPGNIRELQNFIERAVILTSGRVLSAPLTELHCPITAAAASTLDQAEREHIIKALEATKWVIGGPNGAAAKLGLKRTTLLYKLAKLGISRPKL
jgi:formate hydrogenlyase transcriptional activator